MTELSLPKWAYEIKRFITVKPQFLIWGNIYDVYPKEKDGIIITYRLTNYLTDLLADESYSTVVLYEPIKGFTVLEGNPDEINAVIGRTLTKDKPTECSLTDAIAIIEKLIQTSSINVSVILDFASRLPAIYSEEIDEFFYGLFRLCQNAEPKLSKGTDNPRYNAIFWLFDKENDMPAWYLVENSKLKSISLPKPDYTIRKVIVEALSKNILGYTETETKKQNECTSTFIDQTSGLHSHEIVSIVSLAMKEKVQFIEIAEAIRSYKIGTVENPWSKLDPTKIEHAEEILGKRVFGQIIAIKKASDIIKRSAFNLSGSQYSRFSNRPKGILFFAGPTGVGKTELAKGITEMIFGSETSYIRFDMTEFKEKNADQRLIGAPPGYVGYDVGGELTNKIKQNPFSVILFDEIEKANPRILDIFMQILDDGRLTSGRGETVYFSEALIIFTSNLGIFGTSEEGENTMLINEKMEYSEIEKTIKREIEDFFKYTISRPEILNRIGDNIVVFDFIRPEVGEKIYEKMIQSVLIAVKEIQGIDLVLNDTVMEKMKQTVCLDLSMGGRGIGNHVEQIFINPLSRALLKEGIGKGDQVEITDIHNYENQWELCIVKKD